MVHKITRSGVFIWSFLMLVFVNKLTAQPLTFEKLKVSGLNLFYQPEPETKKTTVFICFPGGQGLEPALKSGLSYLTTRLMIEIPDEDKMAQVEEAGLNLRAGSTPDFSFIQLDGLNSSLGKGLKMVSETLNKPLFSGLRIEALKKIMASEERKERTRLVNASRLLLIRKIWPGSPAGNSTYGGEADLKNISKKDISNFYSYVLNPETMFLVVISGLKKEEVSNLISQYFSINKKTDNLANAWKAETPAKKNESGKEYVGPRGAVVMVGFVLNGALASIYPQAFVLEKIIGEGPGCALWNLRQDKAYAYNVNSQLEIIGQKILLLAYLETDPELSETALSDLLQVFRDLYDRGLTPEEIEKGRLLARQTFFRESFNRDSRLHQLATFITNNLPLEFFNSFSSSLLAVSQDSLNTLIKSSLQPEAAVSLVINKN